MNKQSPIASAPLAPRRAAHQLSGHAMPDAECGLSRGRAHSSHHHAPRSSNTSCQLRTKPKSSSLRHGGRPSRRAAAAASRLEWKSMVVCAVSTR